MGIKQGSMLIAFLMLLLPSTGFTEDALTIKTGYDLYHIIKLMDNPQSAEEIGAVFYATGYLAGYLDGLRTMEFVLFNMVFPPKIMSENERNKFAKEMNFHRLNYPKEGLATGHLILIYKKYAEKYPEKLNESARMCLFGSIIEAYGWK